ncbi:DUF935 domain-containing protein [Thiomicrorhabdus sp. Kp2]|uniref:DUF935 domain-containing protein n=1 Tax=Thiomicrorhabdus sp. Kp2 TaxID=1123518 RepID=UPI0003FFB829|nr:DUF935 domain-containing protein [Thiomicrorhabdus sp. Kp2]
MERVSNIVDYRGEPIKVKSLTDEVARPSMTGVRQVWNTDTIAGGLTPERLAQVLESANQGDNYDYLTLAEEMEEREPHYGSVLGTRKRAIEGVKPAVESAADDAQSIKIADAVRRLVKHESFARLVQDCVDALGKGYAVSEILWNRGSVWTPREYKWRDPRHFQFSRDDAHTLRLRDEQDLLNGISLPAYKFVVHIPRLKSGIPARGGLARLAAATYMCKQYTLTDWMAFAEVYGMPIRIGKHGNNATENDIRTLINAVANIGTDAAAVIPESMNIDFVDGRKSGSNDTFERLAKYLDKQISKAVLGQTMTTDDGSSQAQANVHNDVRIDILESDLNQLESTINRDLIKPFIDLNFGVQGDYPKVVWSLPEAENIEAMVNALKELVPLGLKVSASVVRDKIGLPDPAEDDEILGKADALPQQSALNHQACQCPSCHTQDKAINAQQTAEVDDLDDLDDLEKEAMQDWQPQIQAVINPIEQALTASVSLEDFLQKLPGLVESIESSELIIKLAEQTFKARGLGDSNAR